MREIREKVALKDVKKSSLVKVKDLTRVPAKSCETCLQTTHNYEKDLLPAVEQLLKWHKIKINAQGDHYPAGNECYVCFDTRRRFFGDSQDLDHRMTMTTDDDDVRMDG